MTTAIEQDTGAPASAAPPRRSRRRVWAAVIVVVILLAGATTWYVLAHNRSRAIAAANVLDPNGSLSGIFFPDPRDEAAVRVTADDFEEYSRTVPMRKGEPMTILMIVTNESEYPVTVRGSSDPGRLIVTTATEPEDARGGAVNWQERTFAPDVTIAPGRWHYLRAEWTVEQMCLAMGKGAGLQLSDFRVNTLVDGTPRIVEVTTTPIIRAVSESDDEPASCAGRS